MRWPRIIRRDHRPPLPERPDTTDAETGTGPGPGPETGTSPDTDTDRHGTAPRIVALIPAHNEAERIAASLAALRRQQCPPHRVVVVADNCTDDTPGIARANGAAVFASRANRHKKAGALNQALDAVLHELAADDLVLVQDADTVLAPSFVASAIGAMDRTVGAVGGIFYGERGGGLLGVLQRMEFQRYAREITRRGHRADVLTGTATLFRARTLREVKAARNAGRIGGGSSYYSLASLTEDDEITKAVRTLGYRTVSPPGCAVVTEVMTSLPKLWHQRLRWQRGALENLRDYGWTPVTAPYIIRQGFMGMSVLFLALYFVFTGWMLARGRPEFRPFWTAVGLVFVAEKVVTARGAGWRAQLLAGTLAVELAYDLFQHAVYVRSLWDMARRREERWCAT
ncbi:glycosyltransferase [Streptomyces clavuligerus]|uniref:Glycosyl transferase n=2 Tax=Streptomyces clavuligerus TaxID=1901 RepID=E2Q0J6_STRCL|nr:glycosyltransferase family 2 protein [Streptomyces clavuligerus]ANW16936.1 glycosyl transferase [Streptomyces clavuligerus]AXU11465.1 glycosyltransferase family 2 protein [Streptomyces clavuligerus]EFG10539.1 Glycosyl transferase [Streptomyces clavuligerus]MBY6301283.1 glycosyltransferase family 2 protein [Streptomyces clavuligerus]QCS04337.1 glycosyl transferase [Streptomyces clavuligerus]